VQRSPEITKLAWGRIEAAGVEPGRDLKLWPGGGRPWDWRETGTHHVPGIQVADVAELIDHGCRVVVLSRGQQRRLQTGTATLAHLAAHEVEVYVEETGDAVRRYNELAAAGAAVGGLFHSTC
jgi:hypothetical protein